MTTSNAETGNPIPCEEAFDANDDVAAEWFDGGEELIRIGFYVFLKTDLAGSIENTEEHGAGVKIDIAIKFMLFGVGSHFKGPPDWKCGLVHPAYQSWQAQGGLYEYHPIASGGRVRHIACWHKRRDGHPAAEVSVRGTNEILHEKRAKILELARRHGVTSVRVFGSVVRGQDEESSDIDLLITVGTETTPWFPAGLILDLHALLGKQTEIVTERGLNPALRDIILSEAVRI